MIGEPGTIPVGGELPPMTPVPGRLRTGSSKPKGRRTAGDRFQMLNAFVDVTLRGLRRTEIAVWLVLYRDARDGVARTSQADIARRTGMTDRTVRRALGRLRRLGLLVRVYRGGPSRGASAYRVAAVGPADAGGQAGVR